MPSLLPLDLERLIFKTAASQDVDHDSRVRLTLVAKRVYEWVRPILYRVAIVQETLHGTLAIRNWRNTQIADVAPFARHLLSIGGNTTNIIELLSTFHNTENLAIWIGVDIVPKVLKKMNDLPLRMLSFRLANPNLDEAIKYCPALRNISHLQLISLRLTWNDSKALVGFPKLTHLCFDTHVQMGDVVVLLLERCPSLRAMICVPTDNCTIETDDPRFLVLQGPLGRVSLGESIVEWERSANGRIGLWELADIIIEARKDKLLKDNSSFTFSRSNWMDNLNDDGLRWYKELRVGR